jgi:hypothetical protein
VSIVKDKHQKAHLDRLQALQAYMQALSDEELAFHHQAFSALFAIEERRFPAAWGLPCDRWQTPEQRSDWFKTSEGMAWLHSTYTLQPACSTQYVEAEREMNRRAAAIEETSLLRHCPDRSIV